MGGNLERGDELGAGRVNEGARAARGRVPPASHLGVSGSCPTSSTHLPGHRHDVAYGEICLRDPPVPGRSIAGCSEGALANVFWSSSSLQCRTLKNGSLLTSDVGYISSVS